MFLHLNRSLFIITESDRESKEKRISSSFSNSRESQKGVTGLIYVTGDMHGDLSRFKSREFRKLRRKDTLLVCGDFGFLWDGSKKEERTLRWIGRRKYQVLFLEGAYDNLSLLDNYPITDWNGGKVREISGKLRHLCRGSIFTLEDRTIFAFGGGESSSIDSEWYSQWWEKQLPTEQELETAKENLAREDWRVDHIVTHQSSRKIKKLLTMEETEPSVLDVFLDEVREKVEYSSWCFGSFHLDRVIPPKEIGVFEKVVPLEKVLNLDPFGLPGKR